MIDGARRRIAEAVVLLVVVCVGIRLAYALIAPLVPVAIGAGVVLLVAIGIIRRR